MNKNILLTLSPDELELELKRRQLERNYLDFLKFIFKEIRNEPFIENFHHKIIEHELMEVYNGNTQFLIINVPPRYTKTEQVVKGFIAWCIAKNPKAKFIHTSYSDELALDNSSSVKEIIASSEYQHLWPVQLKQDSKSKKKWYTMQGGGVYSTSMGGQMTGFGAGGIGDTFEGAIIIDDPIKPEDARSKTVRENINQRINNTIKSRMNNPKKTPIILIMQRVHEDDLTGFLMNGNTEFKWKEVVLRAIKEEGDNHHMDPRKVGEALWPFKHDVKMLEALRESDPKTYAGQYQQRPAPQEGNIISRDSIKYYRKVPENIRFQVHSWDMTFKDSKKADFVVGTAWASTGKDHYLLGCKRGRMSFTKSLDAVESLVEEFPDYNAILVEDKANGAAIMDVLKRKFSKIIPINPKESKEARFEAVAPMFESGNIHFPHPDDAPWVKDFLEELFVFPNGAHDDRVDSTSQALNYLDKKTRIGLYKMASYNKK